MQKKFFSKKCSILLKRQYMKPVFDLCLFSDSCGVLAEFLQFSYGIHQELRKNFP